MKPNERRLIEAYKERLRLARSGATANPFESREEKQARIDRAKKDILYCAEYYFADYATSETADFQIDLALKSKRQKDGKFLVRWGRGLAKSVWCDVIIPFWLMTNDELHYFVVVGQNADKAKILLGDLQAELEGNPRIIHDFGEQRSQGDWELGSFTTQQGFTAKSLGVGQSPRGLRKKARRPDGISIDDIDDDEMVRNPARVDAMADWIERSLLPIMDGETQRVWFPNNRFAPKTIQSTLEERGKGRKAWTLHEVEACGPAPERVPRWKSKYPADYYQKWDKTIGSLAVDAEYRNIPHIQGKIFKPEMLNYADFPVYPRLDKMTHIVGHWDVAYSGSATGDFNAVRVWGVKGFNFYFIAGFTAQCKMRKAIEWMCWYESTKPPTVTIHWQFEAQFWNDEVERTLAEVQNETGIELLILKVDNPGTNKYDRMVKMAAYYENGRMYAHEKHKSDNMVQVGFSQLWGIEPGYKGKDDNPDADEQCITKLSRFARAIDENSSMPMTGEQIPKQNW